MDLEQAFLADIVARRGDPTLWLIFADWLEDRCDPRSDLVRVWRRLLDEPDSSRFAEDHARFEGLLRAGTRLPLPRYTNSLGMEFVWFPAGRFWMGGRNGIPGEEQIGIADHCFLGIHLVTQGQWRAVMRDNPSAFSHNGERANSISGFTDEELSKFPVENISWEETRTFLQRLNDRERGTSWRYRLPNNVEWEYACRSPVTCRTDCGFTYYFDSPSNHITPANANYDECHLGHPTCIGSYPPNRWGLYDMHGNVWEWMESPRASVRGGAWSRERVCAEASYRVTFTSGYRVSNLGLRVARVPD